MNLNKKYIALALGGLALFGVYKQMKKVTPSYVYRVAQSMQSLFSTNIDPLLVVAMVAQESNFNPTAKRHEPKYLYNTKKAVYKGDGDVSLGLMQVLTSTAFEMFERGYTYFDRPTLKTMENPSISIYFGMAYIDTLQKRMDSANITTSVANIARFYNGGFGSENPNAYKHAEKVLTYYNKYKDIL